MTTWIALAPTQYRLLHLLAAHPNRVITHDQLYAAITEAQIIIEPGQVAWHISKIKNLAFNSSGHELPIENVPARGYILNLPEISIIIVPEANHETS